MNNRFRSRANTMTPEEMISLAQHVNREAPPAIMRVPEAGAGEGAGTPQQAPQEAPQGRPGQTKVATPPRGRGTRQETPVPPAPAAADPDLSGVLTHQLRGAIRPAPVTDAWRIKCRRRSEAETLTMTARKPVMPIYKKRPAVFLAGVGG